MKKILLVAIFSILFLYFLPEVFSYGGASANFTFTINTSKQDGLYGETGITSFKLPVLASGTYNYTINWGDGNSNYITSYAQALTTHTYAVQGVYTININGTFSGFAFGAEGDAAKLINISNYGSLDFGEGAWIFAKCSNFKNITATDTLNLSSVMDASYMFYNAAVFNGNISNWNTSSFLSTGNMFRDAIAFNQNINSWDMSNVGYATQMFRGATSFNQPLNSWNTSTMYLTEQMFLQAAAFNQNLSNWNTGKIVSMAGMFVQATSFNGNVSTWNTSSVISTQAMFSGASVFNQPLNSWDMQRNGDMSSMFFQAYVFNQPLNSWNTSSSATMAYMFFDTNSFNQPIYNWETKNVFRMDYMFYYARNFSQDISSFNVSHCAYFDSFIEGSKIDSINYSKALIAWAKQPLQYSNVYLGAGTLKYCQRANESRTYLVNFGWTITDGGLNTTCYVDTCNYNGIGNWNINISDMCVLSTNVNLSSNSLIVNGSNGILTFNASVIGKRIQFNPTIFNKNFTIKVILGKGFAAIK